MKRISDLDDECRPLLNWTEIGFLNSIGLVMLTEYLVSPPERVWSGVVGGLLHLPPPSSWNSVIVADFPNLFEEFKNRILTLL